MDKIRRSSWQVRVAALVIFVLGFAAGALALNAYRTWVRSAGGQDNGNLVKLFDTLQLNQDQRTQVQQIFGDTRSQLQALRRESEPRVAEIRRQADERLQKVLTPEQWQRFQQMRDDWRRRGGHRGRSDSDSGSSPQNDSR
ncbi:MAG TPA: periplasmic heavy metal sensor [Pyrinomonadaceae bacterium]|jgi:Spy/CpxP family protein refolding chaperone|nr:periplasmic heavy metal sensor [Pyrinomonadaceae bacterium]